MDNEFESFYVRNDNKRPFTFEIVIGRDVVNLKDVDPSGLCRFSYLADGHTVSMQQK